MDSNYPAAVLHRTDGDVLAVIQEQYAAWARGDAEALAACYTDDATVVQPGVYKTSRAEIQATFVAAFAGPLKGSRVLDQTQSVRFLGDDAVIVISEAGVLMVAEAELPPGRLIRATWVLARQGDDRWLIAAFKSSAAA